MGLFAKTRRRSQSYGAVAISPYGNDEDSEFYLPGEDRVFLTKTTLGEPALGRRKSNKLLTDAHFDLLAESIGVPSRGTFVAKQRPASSRSQSSGLLTPVKSQGTQKDEQRRNGTCNKRSNGGIGSPAVGGDIEAERTSAGPIAEQMSHDNSQRLATGVNRVTPSGYDNVPFPSHDSKQPPPLAIPLGQHPMTDTDTGFAPPTYHVLDAGDSPLFHLCYRTTAVPFGVPAFMATQHAAASPSSNVPGLPQSPAAPVVTQTHSRQTSIPIPLYPPVMQHMPTRYAVAVPPAPPPPTEWVRSSPIPVHPRIVPEPRKGEPSSEYVDNAAGSATRSEYAALNTRALDGRTRQDLRVGDQVRHSHICRGCGKKRSSHYHETHPLRRGEIPPPAYCAHCRREAAETLRLYSESSSGYTTDWSRGPGIKSTAHATHSPGGESGQTNRWRRPRWPRRSKAFASISRLFSRKADSHNHGQSKSPSRAESPKVRPHIRVPSDSTPLLDTGQSDNVCPISPSVHNDSRKTLAMRETPRPASCSPLVPRKEEFKRPQEIYNTFPAKGSPRASKQTPVRRRARDHHRQNEPATMPTLEGILLHTDDQPCSSSMSHEVNNSPSAASETRNGKIQYVPPVVSTVDSEVTTSKTSHIELGATRPAEVLVSTLTKPTEESSSPEHHYTKRARRHGHPRRVVPSASRTITKGDENSTEPSFPHHTEPVSFHEAGGHIGPPISDTLDGNANGHVLDQPKGGPPGMSRPAPNSNWDEPATPKNNEWGFTADFPCCVHDSWSQGQSSLEQTAEEMAQHELASAGKLFGSFEEFLYPSGGTFHPVPSPVMRSNLSITSCESDAGSDPNKAALPIAYDSETEGPSSSAGEKILGAKRIEFANEREHNQRATSTRLNRSEVVVYQPFASTGRRGKNLYKFVDREEKAQGGDFDDMPSPIGSSLISHTGHSTDEAFQELDR
ncbi:hypothetical protein F5Y18DRAFT_264932 [Xylariaceae sp. FL1019]|nr:hypothetical protein F5Y18DRAFT_264932 [Xylariaceae sp. FL1019]